MTRKTKRYIFKYICWILLVYILVYALCFLFPLGEIPVQTAKLCTIRPHDLPLSADAGKTCTRISKQKWRKNQWRNQNEFWLLSLCWHLLSRRLRCLLRLRRQISRSAVPILARCVEQEWKRRMSGEMIGIFQLVVAVRYRVRILIRFRSSIALKIVLLRLVRITVSRIQVTLERFVLLNS